MVKQLVFLLEEPSMAEVLKVLLPKVLPDNIGFKLIIHEGKQELRIKNEKCRMNKDL
jgi:hypothetical protein